VDAQPAVVHHDKIGECTANVDANQCFMRHG
jgi:hypothetical protein